MLFKKNRVTKKKDFEKIFKKGVSFREQLLILKVIPGLSSKSRFAFIASQKVSKNATVRNRVRRQLRELMRPLADKVKGGVDGVFIALPGLEDKDFQEVKNIVYNLLEKAKLI